MYVCVSMCVMLLTHDCVNNINMYNAWGSGASKGMQGRKNVSAFQMGLAEVRLM